MIQLTERVFGMKRVEIRVRVSPNRQFSEWMENRTCSQSLKWVGQ